MVGGDLMRRMLGALAVGVLALGLGGGAVARPVRPVPGPPLPQPGPLVVVWSDEFNGAAGTGPDPRKWRPVVMDCCGNEQQSYIDSRDTSAHDGEGHMVITPIQRQSPTGRAYV